LLAIFVCSLFFQSNACPYQLNYFNLANGLQMPYYTTPGTTIVDQLHGRENLVVVIHGTTRDAYNYYCSMNSSVISYLGHTASLGTFIFAPMFCISTDSVRVSNTIYWDDNEYWKDAIDSTVNFPNQRESSFAIIDELIMYILENQIFPDLTNIIVAGHSAGGQFVQRYALTTQIVENIADTYGHPVRFIVANPSSYAYLNSYRQYQNPSYTCENYCVVSQVLATSPNWIIPHNPSCSTYDDWKYGLSSSLPPYVTQSPADLMTQYFARTVVYMAGLNDTCNEIFLDNSTKCVICSSTDIDQSCEAEYQGNCRLQRAVNFYNHLRNFTTTNTHVLVFVPNAGHSAYQMFTAPLGQAMIFSGALNYTGYLYNYTTSSQSTSQSHSTSSQTTSGSSVVSVGCLALGLAIGVQFGVRNW